jgi:hypothetical protein
MHRPGELQSLWLAANGNGCKQTLQTSGFTGCVAFADKLEVCHWFISHPKM